jgi:hypothetical protein
VIPQQLSGAEFILYVSLLQQTSTALYCIFGRIVVDLTRGRAS